MLGSPTAITYGAANRPAAAGPLGVGGAGNKCQRGGDLPDGDLSDPPSPHWLAAVADCQRELAGDGWLGVCCHGGLGWHGV